MSLSRGRGQIRTDRGRAVVVARCPLCGEEHRYDKGVAGGEEIESLRKLGYTDEWLPCQLDLPGNFWRIVIIGGRQGASQYSPRRARRAKAKLMRLRPLSGKRWPGPSLFFVMIRRPPR